MRDPRNFEFILIISSFPRIPIISHRDRLRDITASKQLVAYKNLHTWTSHSTFPIPITITDATHEYSNAHFAETRHENPRQVDTFPREISTHVIRTHLLRLQFACAKLANKHRITQLPTVFQPMRRPIVTSAGSIRAKKRLGEGKIANEKLLFFPTHRGRSSIGVE